ncbi:MAG: hypothetical protein QOH35_1105, partial [Acidobacteriaceae bacterium]|nr:hypothetical protein [Acidobacteriaceae bacterium]
ACLKARQIPVEPNPQNPQGNSKSNATLGGELLYGFRLK